MNTLFPHLLTLLRQVVFPLALLINTGLCFAQTAAESPPVVTPPAEDPVAPALPAPAKLRFIFLDETLMEYTISLDRAKPMPLVSNGFAISAPLMVPDGTTIRIFRHTPTTKPLRIAELKPRPDLGSALVVMSPLPDDDSLKKERKPSVPRYRDTWIDDSTKNFGAGQLRIINLSRNPARITVASSFTQIEPSGAQVITPDWDGRGRVRVLLETQQDAKWTGIYDNTISHRAGERVTGIIVHSDQGLAFSYTEQELNTFGRPAAGDFLLTYTDSK